jgi:hypothetical protein
MNRLKVRFFLTVLVVLCILYSKYIYHTYDDTRKGGVIGDPLYLSRRVYAYWEQIIQYLRQH